MYKVLVVGMTSNPGGMESVVRNYYQNIDKSKIQFDFLCVSQKPIAYENEYVKHGAHVYHITARSQSYINFERELFRFFKKNEKKYQAVWQNECSLVNIDYLFFAKMFGIPRRIIHCHNSNNMGSQARLIFHKLNQHIVKYIATDFWTCSEDSNKWFFGEKNKLPIVQINNGIDTESYSFSATLRKKWRKYLKWENNYIIGNVGRLHFQKNQLFLLELFSEVIKSIPEARLVLVGQGEDFGKITGMIHKLRLEEYVYLAGVQNDIQGWLSAFDLFCFPSMFEGLSLSALEAQANGIPILASENAITPSIILNRNIQRLSLSIPKREWVNEIVSIYSQSERLDQNEVNRNFLKSQYDIKTEALKFEKLLLDI